MNRALLHSRIREDEKPLLAELRGRGHEVTKVDACDPAFSIGTAPDALADVDLAFNRCVESSPVRYVAELVDHYDVPVVDSPRTTRICADEVRGSVDLDEAGVPTPEPTWPSTSRAPRPRSSTSDTPASSSRSPARGDG